MTSFLCLLVLGCPAFAAAASGTSAGDRKVRLRDVPTLTFYQGRQTLPGRRGPPIPQLSCVRGDACGFTTPTVVQCHNQGVDPQDLVQWSCTGTHEDLYRLGQTNVSCEGYEGPHDHLYVTRGTCGLEYGYWLTSKGREYFGGGHGRRERGDDPGQDLSWLWIVGFVVIVVIMVVMARRKERERGMEGYGRVAPDGGGPPGGPGGDAPPPYNSPKPGPYASHSPYAGYPSAPPLQQDTSYSRSSSSCRDHHRTTDSHTETNNQGFWRGLGMGGAAGGALGYLFGSRNRGNPVGSAWPTSGGWPRGESSAHSRDQPVFRGRTPPPSHSDGSRRRSPSPPRASTSTGYGTTSIR